MGLTDNEPSIYRSLFFLGACVCIHVCANAHVLGAYSCVCMHVEVRGQHWMPVLRYLPFLTFLKNIVSLTCLELAALDNVGWPEIPGIYLSTFPTLASKEGDNMPMPCFYLFIF